MPYIEIDQGSQSLAAGATVTVGPEFATNGTLRGLRIAFPVGCECLVSVTPGIQKYDGGLVYMGRTKAGTGAGFAGDGEVLWVPQSIVLTTQDQLQVTYVNKDTNYAHKVQLHWVVETNA